MDKIENIQQALDLAIRNSEVAKQKSGYEVEGREYPNYLSKQEFEEFIKKMKKTPFYKQYKDADGGELEEKRGRWGLYPPKMACFGSSSRFIYRLLRTREGVVFEKKLPTMVGGEANLDAYIKGICEIFIEAKCREIYSSHNSTEINECYEDVFKYLARKLDWFGYRKVGGSTKTNYSKYSIYYNDRQIKRFDVKQLICHFLGISASVLEGTTEPNIKFIYLIFNPNSVAEHIEKYKEKILDQYAEALKEIEYFDMKALFKAIFEFQKNNPRVKKNFYGDFSFEFHHVDQYGWKTLFE